MKQSVVGRRRSIIHEKTVQEDEKRSHPKFVNGICPTCGRRVTKRKHRLAAPR